MKLPSISYLTSSAAFSLKRFPVTLLYALISVILAIWLIENNENETMMLPYINALLCSALGIVLSFAIYMYSEKWQCTPKWRLIFQMGGALVLFGLYFTFPGKDSTHNYSMPYIRYGLYNVTVHLMVAVIPFIKGGQINGFWNYNKSLFLRFLGAALFSGVLYAGLAIALGSLDFLFNIDLHDELFGELWVVIAGIFNTWFFLSGIPKDLDALEENHQYPKGLKIFAQYVLLPLLILYLVILYAYASKIVLSDSWPKGLVPYLVSSVSVLGILTCMLLYPYGKQEESKWIGKFSRIYYFLLVPLVAMLFVALAKRLDDYGITISRYALFALGIWLVLVCGYFIIGKKNIKFVPASLALALILISFGPWGMFSWSERSQVNRLEKILTDAKILVDGKIVNEVMLPDSVRTGIRLENLTKSNDDKLSDSLKVELHSIIRYLGDHHGFKEIRGWFKQDIDGMITKYNVQLMADTSISRYQRRFRDEEGAYFAALGVTEIWYSGDVTISAANFYSFTANDDDAMSARNIERADYYDEFSEHSFDPAEDLDSTVEPVMDTIKRENMISYSIGLKSPYLITIWFKGDSAKAPLQGLVDSLMKNTDSTEPTNNPLPQEFRSLDLVGKSYNYKVYFNDINLKRSATGDTLKMQNVYGYTLIKKK